MFLRNTLTAATFAAALSLINAPGVMAGEDFEADGVSQQASQETQAARNSGHDERKTESGKGFLGRFFSGIGDFFSSDEDRQQTASADFEWDPMN